MAQLMKPQHSKLKAYSMMILDITFIKIQNKLSYLNPLCWYLSRRFTLLCESFNCASVAAISLREGSYPCRYLTKLARDNTIGYFASPSLAENKFQSIDASNTDRFEIETAAGEHRKRKIYTYYLDLKA
jgi:hypothetical protein